MTEPSGQLYPSLGIEKLDVAPNSGIELTTDTLTEKILSTIYNTTVADAEGSVPVGGAPSLPASDWKAKNLVQVLDTILFPELFPVYTLPTLTLSASQSGTKEVGEPISQVLSLSATKNDAGPFTSLVFKRGGSPIETISPAPASTTNLPDQFGYPNTNNPNLSYSETYTDSITVVAGTTSWNGTGDFDAGNPLDTSKGTSDNRPFATLSVNAPQAAGSLTTASTSVTGIYPYFWGKSSTLPTASDIATAIEAGTETKVLQAASGTISATFGATDEYIWFAHPATYTSKTIWYFTALNQGVIGPDSFINNPVTQAVNSPNSYWTAVSYKIYISNYASTTTGALELRNS